MCIFLKRFLISVFCRLSLLYTPFPPRPVSQSAETDQNDVPEPGLRAEVPGQPDAEGAW